MRKKKKSLQKKIYIGLGISFFLFLVVGLFYITKVRPFNLSLIEALENLANPTAQYVKIIPGMRKEQVAQRFGTVLGWSQADKQTFIKNTREGYLLPDTYLIPVGSNPQQVSSIIIDNFNKKITAQIQPGMPHASVINLDTAVKIASIIERETGGKSDMRIISGVIWNRMFQGIPLDIDATLQYAKGTSTNWWPAVVPADKNIDSPYNTYQNPGFPPTAIAEPSETAIWAAFNPIKTTALYYLHDKNGIIHTAATYQQHLANIAYYYKRK